jgi:hypothetical protein
MINICCLAPVVPMEHHVNAPLISTHQLFRWNKIPGIMLLQGMVKEHFVSSNHSKFAE